MDFDPDIDAQVTAQEVLVDLDHALARRDWALVEEARRKALAVEAYLDRMVAGNDGVSHA